MPAADAGIDAALAGGDLAGAVTLARAALAAGQRTPLALHLVGWNHAETGALAAAEPLLAEALALTPDDASLMATLAQVLRRQGRISQALALLDRAVALAPGDAVAWLERGFAQDVGAAWAAAADSYARAAAIDPGLAAAHAGLASLAARQGDAAAADHGVRALALDPGNVLAACAVARTRLAGGDAAAAVAMLDSLAPATAEERILVQGHRGDAHHRLGDTGAAFAGFAAAKAEFAALHGPGQQIALIERLIGELDGLEWPAVPAAPAPVANHAFLLGYPRSGTSLVETILAALPGVETLEERPTLGAVAADYIQPPGGLARLAALADVAPWRAHYWQAAARFGARLDGGTLIDMDPMKGLLLPAIVRLFPDAPVVIMRRDPRDVVWSCFRTSFAPSAAALHFTSLAETARHYDAMMRLTEAALARLPVNFHVLRYEDLVGDFDATTRALCDVLRLPWTPALRDFNRSSGAQRVVTASAAQVRRGLYDGSGQWRPYAAQIAEVMPILQPWINKYQY